MQLGYHASHEVFAPEQLLHFGKLATEMGFKAISSSDHVTPWSVRQGHSGFNWVWLASLLEGTNDVEVGTLAIPGDCRYHPILVAQAFATLARMYAGRVKWIAAGSGETMNEQMFGKGWPEYAERNQRMREGVEIIRALWQGEEVTCDGLIKAERAKIWSLPEAFPLIYGAALSQETAAFIAPWADGLLTIRQDHAVMKGMIEAFRSHGGQGKPLVLQLLVSWAETRDQARMNAHTYWRHVALTGAQCQEYVTAEEFDEAVKDVRPEEMDPCLLLAETAEEIIQHINEYIPYGFDEIYLLNAGHNQADFIRLCGREILPAFKEA